jgi:hypothetical protein
MTLRKKALSINTLSKNDTQYNMTWYQVSLCSLLQCRVAFFIAMSSVDMNGVVMLIVVGPCISVQRHYKEI